MKKLRLLSLIGITLVAIAQVGWARGRGAAPGPAFSGGGGGGRGGARAGVMGVPQSGGALLVPHANFGGSIYRGGGVGWGVYRPSIGITHTVTPATSAVSARSFVPSRSPVLQNRVGHSTRTLTNVGGGNKTAKRAPTPSTHSGNRGGSLPSRAAQASGAAGARPSNEAALNRDHHIIARQNGTQHRDWDRRHAHFYNGNWYCWDGAYWIGLDSGYYPWDFYPYNGYDYYPYDYYTDVEQSAQDYAQQADPNVSAVQSDLAQLGYYDGPIDGIFGADTRTALARYQVDHQLQVTGSLTNDTLQSLGLPGLAFNF